MNVSSILMTASKESNVCGSVSRRWGSNRNTDQSDTAEYSGFLAELSPNISRRFRFFMETSCGAWPPGPRGRLPPQHPQAGVSGKYSKEREKSGKKHHRAQWALASSKDSTPESQVLAASFSCRLLMISCSSEPELFWRQKRPAGQRTETQTVGRLWGLSHGEPTMASLLTLIKNICLFRYSVLILRKWIFLAHTAFRMRWTAPRESPFWRFSGETTERLLTLGEETWGFRQEACWVTGSLDQF